MSELLKDHLSFRNGKTSPDRTETGQYTVFGSNGPIGHTTTKNADGPFIVIGRVGSYCGSLYYSESDAWVTDNAIVCTSVVPSETRYWHYLLQTLDLNSRSSGSGQPLLNQSVLGGIEACVATAGERQAIAEVLGALDDKIAANTKLAATADEFIRASLLQLNEYAKSTTTIGDLALNRKELVDPTNMEPETHYVGLEHIPRRSLWLDSAGSASSVTSTKAGFHSGDVLFGKLRPYFHKVVSAPFHGVCSTDVLVLASREPDLAGFLLASVSSNYVVERVTAASEGTRMPRTSWKDLSAVEIAWPGDEKAREFSAGISPLRHAVEGLFQENSKLTATRDALLPQLMSGKLRVKDAEALVSAAV